MKTPYRFDEFFASGMEESISPFLTPDSKGYSKHLPLKASLLAAFLLTFSFAISFTSAPLSSLALCCVYFLVGTRALIASLEDLKNLEINIDVLMTLAAFAALFLGSGLEGGLLLVLFELSHGMEDAVSKKAKSALHNLNDLSPKFATLLAEDGTLFQKSVREIEIGEKILVQTGEIVPLDGIVIAGKSLVNLVHLTGESRPVPKGPGDEVVAGTRNLDAALTFEVKRISADSTLARIIRLITEAAVAKPKVQRMLDRFGHTYASCIIAFTIALALFLPLLFSQIGYLGNEGAFYRSLAFLIAASPCALIIATPTAYLSAISACAKRGILLKGGVTLDALASCKTIAFDKTGTLTKGELNCIGIEPIGNPHISVSDALSIAYGLEREVIHPIARAICRFAMEQGLSPSLIENFRSIPGTGLEGKVKGVPVFIGLPERVQERFTPSQKKNIHSFLQKRESNILALLLVEEDLFLFRFSDTVRDKIDHLIHEIKNSHSLLPVMLTGDHQDNAEEVGKLAGIDQIYANLRPEDKLLKIGELLEKGPLAMVGDGINDAPALARATVGISMGKVGSSVAIDASDVILLNDDLHLLPWLVGKSRKTAKIVRQNISLALLLIAAASIPSLLGFLPLWAAVLLHEGGTLLVGLNSLRLTSKT
ncbi:MAG TPA: heavy metal translocating P-type ATPase [Chlamydiales bacterium]|nr:heavy metal translocating P-type ATPase [Chlamydiales bacterium]